jgi:hypothetical protein
MFKHLSILPLIALCLSSVACDGTKEVKLPKDDAKSAITKDSKDAKDTSATAVDPENRSASTSDSGSSTPNPSGAFETKLTSLVTQKAPWGDIEISVEKARLLRGAKPEGFPSAAKHSTSELYAILDVKLDSHGDLENDYSKRDTWDLMLKDGTRVKPLNALGVVLPADGSKNATLFYKVDGDAKLDGASLEINGKDRDALEPLAIPLDQKREFASQAKVQDLIGKSFEPDDDSGLRFEILDAQYGVNLVDSGRRAPRDQRLVELKVRVGYEGSRDEVSFSSTGNAPRLAFDGQTFSPDAFDARSISSGDSHDFVMVYPIAEAASHIDLTVDGGKERLERDIELPSLLDQAVAAHDSETASSRDDSDDDEFTSNDDSDDESWSDASNDSDDSEDSADDSSSNCDEWGWCEDSSDSSDSDDSSWCDDDSDDCSDDSDE